MNRFYSFVTYAFFAYVAYKLVVHHGARWEFGAYGLPHPLIAADGLHYLDGTLVELTIRRMVAYDIVVEVQLIAYSLVAVWIVLMIHYVRLINRNRRKLQESRALNAHLDRLLLRNRNCN